MVKDIYLIETEFPAIQFRLEKKDWEDLIYFSGMKGSAIAKQLCKYFLELCRKNEILKKEIRELQIKDLEKKINKIQYLNSRVKIAPLNIQTIKVVKGVKIKNA